MVRYTHRQRRAVENVRFVLERLREGDEHREALLDLERAAEHCAQLTRSLLAFSRQTTQPTPRGARPNLWPELLIDLLADEKDIEVRIRAMR